MACTRRGFAAVLTVIKALSAPCHHTTVRTAAAHTDAAWMGSVLARGAGEGRHARNSTVSARTAQGMEYVVTVHVH